MRTNCCTQVARDNNSGAAQKAGADENASSDQQQGHISVCARLPDTIAARWRAGEVAPKLSGPVPHR